MGETKEMSTRTYTPTAADAEAGRAWYIIDAKGQTLGRLATLVAQYLRGKHKPTFAPHMDMGDYVVVINASQVVVTGAKNEDKMYYRHSGRMGNLKTIPYNEMIKKHPTFPVEDAVRGMLPHNSLGVQMLAKLKVYAGPKHPHVAQKPVELRINSDNETLEVVSK
jgi:large subunit ribosomal protein L13